MDSGDLRAVGRQETESGGAGGMEEEAWEKTAKAALDDLLVHLSKIEKTEDKLIWILISVNKCCNYSIETVHRLEDDLILVKNQLQKVKNSDKQFGAEPILKLKKK